MFKEIFKTSILYPTGLVQCVVCLEKDIKKTLCPRYCVCYDGHFIQLPLYFEWAKANIHVSTKCAQVLDLIYVSMIVQSIKWTEQKVLRKMKTIYMILHQYLIIHVLFYYTCYLPRINLMDALPYKNIYTHTLLTIFPNWHVFSHVS